MALDTRPARALVGAVLFLAVTASQAAVGAHPAPGPLGSEATAYGELASSRGPSTTCAPSAAATRRHRARPGARGPGPSSGSG